MGLRFLLDLFELLLLLFSDSRTTGSNNALFNLFTNFYFDDLFFLNSIVSVARFLGLRTLITIAAIALTRSSLFRSLFRFLFFAIRRSLCFYRFITIFITISIAIFITTFLSLVLAFILSLITIFVMLRALIATIIISTLIVLISRLL